MVCPCQLKRLKKSRSKSCGTGQVRIAKRVALRLLDWHPGQGSPEYAVGSSGYAGRCVPLHLVEEAQARLSRVASRSTGEDRRILARLVRALGAAARRAR